MVIPYTDNSAHVKDDYCTERRLEYTKGFLSLDDIRERVLDVGERNYVGKILAPFADNTVPSDFNYGISAPHKVYQTVFCFEVIEHVMSPLQLLCQIRNLLGPEGILYLSTPVRNKYGFMFNETCHFTEYSINSIKTVVEYAGFKITQHETFRSIPFWKGMIKGGGFFRTFLRVSSQRTQILRAVKV